MYRLESDDVYVKRHVDDVYHKFSFISCKLSKFRLHFNIRKSFVNVLFFKDVFSVYFVVFWILFRFFFKWKRLVWGTRLFFVEIVFFVFGSSLSISIESSFVIFYRRGSSWFFVVFPFSYWSRVFRIELWNLIS